MLKGIHQLWLRNFTVQLTSKSLWFFSHLLLLEVLPGGWGGEGISLAYPAVHHDFDPNSLKYILVYHAHLMTQNLFLGS